MSAMTEDAKKKRLAALVQLHADLLEKFTAVNQEMADLLGGGAGIGAKLKACYKAFDAAWGERYANGEPGHYQWAFQQDASHLKRFLRTMTVEELSRRFVAYIADVDPFLLLRRHPFRLFVRDVNTYAPVSGTAFDLEAPTVSDCKHLPRCTSDQHHTKLKMQEIRA